MNSITLSQKDIARFWSKVRVGDLGECWECIPQIVDKKSGGYGRIGIDGHLFLAHRVSWAIAHGQIPGSLEVLHKCDNRPCVNPNHLFLGTQCDNNKDAKQKGRTTRGEAVVISKLKERDIATIREMLSSGISTRKLARMYNVSSGTISKINTGRTWSWLK